MHTNCSTTFSASHTVQTWPSRLWQEQARRLYPGESPRQQRAILEHIQIAQACTMSLQRWLWLAEIGVRLVEQSIEEVAS